MDDSAPSKKRAAETQLSRDKPVEDDEHSPEQETGTFKRATDQVLATRKIVKVRRQPPSATTTPSNPFSRIQLVGPPPTENTPSVSVSAGERQKPFSEAEPAAECGKLPVEEDTETNPHSDEAIVAEGEAVVKPLSEAGAVAEGGELPVENPVSAVGNAEAVEKPLSEAGPVAEGGKLPLVEETLQPNEGDHVSGAAVVAGGEAGLKEETAPPLDEEDKRGGGDGDGGAFSSFQILPGGENAFKGAAGSGFGGFSRPDLLVGPATHPGFSIGVQKRESNGNSQVVAETGEEEERTVFQEECTLFEFAEGGWKERGRGEVKVNRQKDGGERGRMVMRSKGNYRLILNSRIYPDIKLTQMERRGVTFSCLNGTGRDGGGRLSTYAVKFKEADAAGGFSAAVMEEAARTTGPKELEDGSG